MAEKGGKIFRGGVAGKAVRLPSIVPPFVGLAGGICLRLEDGGRQCNGTGCHLLHELQADGPLRRSMPQGRYSTKGYLSRKYNTIYSMRFVSPGLHTVTRSGAKFTAFASRSFRKKLTKAWKKSKSGNLKGNDSNSKDQEEFTNKSPQGDAGGSDIYSDLTSIDFDARSPLSVPSRGAVLQACILTSGLILALGAIIRQASHIAFTEGWTSLDSTEISFHFETWHLELITALAILISSCRYILLKTWPDFAESSETANQQVLSPLQPIDYMIVAFLPGISEELLFRGGLLPLFGLNWMSALVVAAIFGCLHLGGGRKYSFAVWATFVGFAYGMATIVSSSMIVPMASHSLNNLIGGVVWRYESTTRKKSSS